MSTEYFTSRWGLLAAALGMAIGTGNIWRFPRVLAENGGGTFLIPWLLFLFLWSIPLLVLEGAFGRASRKGTYGAFVTIAGNERGWMGAFIGICSTAIMCYYCVVMGWCLKYLSAALLNEFQSTDIPGYWEQFFTVSYQPLLFHILAAAAGMLIIARGVVAGIERLSRILIPALFLLLIIGAVRSVTLPGALDGLQYMFRVNLSQLLHHKVWLEALTQSAWSTGAGWGLLLTYGVYMRQREGLLLNAGVIGFGNNSASLLAALVIIPTAFALYTGNPESLLQNPGGHLSNGLAFIWIPELFLRMAGGQFYLIIFFLGLSVAALSSLVAMAEMAVRNLIDLGFTRKKSVLLVLVIVIIFGTPSALSPDFFANQDWVWGIGLMVNGFLLAIGAILYGVTRFTEDYVNSGNDIFHAGKWFRRIIMFIIPLEFVILIGWWFFSVGDAI